MTANLLELITESDSSRALNCLRITLGINQNGTPDQSKFLFASRALNYTIFYKTTSTDAKSPVIDTVLFFPNDYTQLEKGGPSFSLNSAKADRFLTEFANHVGVLDGRSLADDIALLTVFKATPSFDPFILKSACTKAGITMPAAYARVSNVEWDTVHESIRKTMFSIIRFGLPNDPAFTARIDSIVEKIWDGSYSGGLDPMTKNLGIADTDTTPNVFAWKGILLTQYIYGAIAYDMREKLDWVRDYTIPVDHCDPPVYSDILEKRDQAIRLIRVKTRSITTILEPHAAFIRNLNKDPRASFKDLFLNAPADYNLAANAVNKLDHALEKIGRMMVDTSPRLITSSEAVVLFNSLVKILE